MQRRVNNCASTPSGGIGFEEATEIFDSPYYLDQRSDDPEQFRAVGWVRGNLYSVIFEFAKTTEGNATTWSPCENQRNRNTIYMSSTRRKPKKSAELIARLADKGEDVSRFFTNKGRMVHPVQRVNVDFASAMLEELDAAAKDLNVSRQAVIKSLVRQALDQHYLARTAAKRTRR